MREFDVETLSEFDGKEGEEGISVMLLRKSSDFLIYAECNDEELGKLLEEIGKHLDDSKNDWGLDSRYHHFKFAHGHSAEEAINRIFSIH